MNTTLTTAAAIGGGVGITPLVQDCVSDVFSWCHLVASAPPHPGSWASLLTIGACFAFHIMKGKADAQTSKP